VHLVGFSYKNLLYAFSSAFIVKGSVMLDTVFPAYKRVHVASKLN